MRLKQPQETVVRLCYFVLSLRTISASVSTGENHAATNQNLSEVVCSTLRMGQYYCKDPEIDRETQQAKRCSQDTKTVKVVCEPAPGLICKDGDPETNGSTFYKEVPCKWTNGKSFKTALLLSIFLGMFGIDRFYLGYPAIGLMKFCTFGFMFLGQLFDILLIALQVVGPSDGSAYVMDFYGAGLTAISRNNETYVKPQEYT